MMSRMGDKVPTVLPLLLLTCCQLGHSAAQGDSYCVVDPGSPYFKTQSLFFREDVLENLPQDSELMTLLVYGADHVTLSIIEGDDRVKLTDRNVLRVNNSLGSRTYPNGDILNIELKLICANDLATVDLSVVISVMQINDNSPQFIGAPYVGNISELAQVGSTVYKEISTQDKDGDTVFYSILSGPFYDHFWFPNMGQGIVALLKPIDYELVHEVVLIISAEDTSESAAGFNTTTTLTVRVLDGDDQNPRFQDGPYSAHLQDNAEPGAVLDFEPMMYAVDPDVNINSPISYSIIYGSDETEYFKINHETGAISLQNYALRRGDKLTFLVQASQTDNPDRYATSLVRVLIQASNFNPPRFVDREYRADVVENVRVGTTVARLEAIDNDMEVLMTVELPVSKPQGAVLTFSILTKPGVTEFFTVDEEKGLVSTVRSLASLAARSVTFTVSVTDGQYSDTAEVVVSVEDVNDHSPVFAQDVMTFDLNTRDEGTAVTQLVATDTDPNSVVTYAFMGNVTEFSLSPSTGELVLSVSEEQELRAGYTLVVRASDSGTPLRQATVVVHVSFGAETGGLVYGGGESSGYLLIIVIVLGVLSAVLLAAITVLLVILYRNSCKEQPNKPVRSQSFEKNLNFASKDYKSYMNHQQQQNPAGITYKPTGGATTSSAAASSGRRHLEIYDAVHLDEDSTQTAQNPFNQGGDTYPPRHLVASNPYSIDGVTRSSSTVCRQMVEVNEIDYETAVSPLDDMFDHKYEDSDSMTSSGGVGGGGVGGGGAGAYRMGGSTQALVSSSAATHRAGNHKKGGGSNLSFVDSPMNSLYSSNNSQIAPTSSGLGTEGRPGITIYY